MTSRIFKEDLTFTDARRWTEARRGLRSRDMLATIACIALLLVIGYFAVLCATEAITWVRERFEIRRPSAPKPTRVPQRQPVIAD